MRSHCTTFARKCQPYEITRTFTFRSRGTRGTHDCAERAVMRGRASIRKVHKSQAQKNPLTVRLVGLNYIRASQKAICLSHASNASSVSSSDARAVSGFRCSFVRSSDISALSRASVDCRAAFLALSFALTSVLLIRVRKGGKGCTLPPNRYPLLGGCTHRCRCIYERLVRPLVAAVSYCNQIQENLVAVICFRECQGVRSFRYLGRSFAHLALCSL